MNNPAREILEERRKETLERLERLMKVVETYAESDISADYGHAGAMGHVNEELGNLLNFIGKPEPLTNKKTGEKVGEIYPDGVVSNGDNFYRVSSADREWLRQNQKLDPRDIKAVGELLHTYGY